MTFYDQPPGGTPAWHKGSDIAWAGYAAAVFTAAEHAGRDNPAAVQEPLLTGGASGRRGASGYRSYSNGNGPDDDRLPLDGWVTRAAHWWWMG